VYYTTTWNAQLQQRIKPINKAIRPDYLMNDIIFIPEIIISEVIEAYQPDREGNIYNDHPVIF